MPSLSMFLDRVQGRYQRSLVRRFGRRDYEFPSGPPLISFTFDDFPCSALDHAGKLLEDRRWAGTYYTSIGLMDTVAPTGRIFDRERLLATPRRGHELGCHTFEHCHAWDTAPEIFEASLAANAEALSRLIPGAVFRTHSYPIGLPRPDTKHRAGRRFACCRGGGQTFNVGRVDLNNLAAFFIEKSRDNPERMQEVVDRNSEAGGWLIFATHDVCENPTRYGCTPGVFEKVLEMAARSGATVLPVYQALELIAARAPRVG